jgi:GT2 family glycosyltransferase
VLPVAVRQIAAVRNAGAAAAAGRQFVFVDADTVVNERVVAAAIRALDAGAVGGGARVRWDGAMPPWASALEWMTVVWIRVARMAAGCFVFCSREAFHAVGGFSKEHYAGEELYLSRALKRHGRFVILAESVITSGRKFRTYSLWELTRALLALGWLPWRGLRDRTRLPLWYGARRDDDQAVHGRAGRHR